MGSEVPLHDMGACSSCNQLLSSIHQSLSQGLAIRQSLLAVLNELWGHYFLELGGECRDLLVVRSALAHREYCKVDLVEKLFAAKNHTRSRPSETFMRGRSHDVAIRKRVVHQLSRNEPTVVSHIAHQNGSTRVCNLSKSFIVEVLGVCACSDDQQLWFKLCCFLSQGIHIDQVSLFIYIVMGSFEIVA